MKKLIALILTVVLCLSVVGCNNSTDTASTEPSGDFKITSIPLGSSVDKVLGILKEQNVAIKMPNYEELTFPEDIENPKQDGRIYNYTDYSFYYTLADYEAYLTFNDESTLSTISVFDSKLQTAEGLSVGDDISEVEKLYKADCQKDVEDISVYQYRLSYAYLNIYYQNNSVVNWSLSIYSNINND